MILLYGNTIYANKNTFPLLGSIEDCLEPHPYLKVIEGETLEKEEAHFREEDLQNQRRKNLQHDRTEAQTVESTLKQ